MRGLPTAERERFRIPAGSFVTAFNTPEIAGAEAG